jgi:uncharacterized peroxidase-related enzyme
MFEPPHPNCDPEKWGKKAKTINQSQKSNRMSRIQQIDPATASGKARQLLDAVQSHLGIVPNLTRVLANSPAALEGYLSFSGALAGGVLGAKVREEIAIAVAQGNHCDYCLSAHTFLGGKVGLNEKNLADARLAIGVSDKDNAILKLALSVLVQQGQVSDAAIKHARAAGLNDAEIIETTAQVALNIFTNYINHVAQTVVDFPGIKSSEVETVAGKP